MNRLSVVLASVVVLGGASAAGAQEIPPPPRISQPPPVENLATSGRSLRQLLMSANLFGGYDRNLIPPVAIQAPGVTPRIDSYTGRGAASLAYSITGGARSLNLAGGGSIATRPVSGREATEAMYGVTADASFQTPLGVVGNVSVSQAASRTPYYSMGVFGALQPGISYSPEGNPVNGVFDGYLWSVNSAVGLGHSWSRHTTTFLSYNYRRNLHEGGVSAPMNYITHSGAVSTTQQIGQNLGVTAGYSLENRDTTQAGFQYDDLVHALTAGFSYNWPISATRTLSIGAGGGATQIDQGDGTSYWQPTYNASLGVDIGRTWVASATFAQTTYLLASPLSAPDSYLTQTLAFNVGGGLSQNVTLVLSSGVSRGDAAAIYSVAGVEGKFAGVFTGLQFSTAISSGWTARVSANYYKSTLEGAAKQFLATAGDFQRASVWAGLDWRAPVFQSPRQPRTPRRRGEGGK